MKKKKSINLITLILIGVIVILSFVIIILINKKITKCETLKEKIEVQEFKWESENIKGKSIDVDSELGKLVVEYLPKIYLNQGAFYEQIVEFNNIENAPKEYIHSCVISEIFEEDARKLNEVLIENNNNPKFNYQNYIIENSISNTGISYEEYNDILVKLFGEKTNNLISQSSLEQLLPEKYKNGRYKIFGYGGSEWDYFIPSIKSIEKRNDILYVEIYEYKKNFGENSYQVFDMLTGSVPLEECYDYEEYIYNRSGEVITKIKNKFLLEESKKNNSNTPVFKEYYEDGTEVSKSDITIFEKYSDKMSVRGLEIKYNEEEGTLYLLRNKLLTN